MLGQYLIYMREQMIGKIPKGAKRSNKWPQVRSAHLKSQPICQVCGGKKNLQVHHIKAFHIHPELELEPSNLITLCEEASKNDHLLFGHLRSFKSINEKVMEDVVLWRGKIKNRP